MGLLVEKLKWPGSDKNNGGGTDGPRINLEEVDAIVAAEAMAFVFASPIASKLGKPLLVARKSRMPGSVSNSAWFDGSNAFKLGGQAQGSNTTIHEEEDDTGSSTALNLQLHLMAGSIIPGQGILIVDDCLASGSTLECLKSLIEMQGGRVVGLACVMELFEARRFQGRRGNYTDGIDIPILSLVQFPGR